MFYPCCKDIKNRQNLSLDLADCENNFKKKIMNRMRETYQILLTSNYDASLLLF